MSMTLTQITHDDSKLSERNLQLQLRIIGILQELGFPKHISGYCYLITAISTTYNASEKCPALWKDLYPKIAKGNGTTASRVGDSIRHAIKQAQARGNLSAWKKYFESMTSGQKVTTGSFIIIIAEYLRLEDEQRKQQEISGQSIKLRITNIMRRLNVAINSICYYQLTTAIEMVYNDPDLVRTLSSGLYYSIAKKFSATASQVEENIKRAIKRAWNCGNLNIWEEYFGTMISKPSNGKFIRVIAYFLRLEDERQN